MDSVLRVKVNGQATTASKVECPICFSIPRANIFQCKNGHSLCDVCSTKVTSCPTCRSPEVGIRNLMAESLLDDMRFKCSWSVQGCNKTMLRGELSTHEDLCNRNPYVRWCSLLHNPNLPNTCQQRWTSIWLSEPQNYSTFVNHIRTCSNSDCIGNFDFGTTYNFDLKFPTNHTDIISPSSPALFIVYGLFSFQSATGKMELFLRAVMLKSNTAGLNALSWVFVQLTPGISPIVLRITMNGNTNYRMGSQWGQNSSSTLSWVLKPIYWQEFKRMVKLPQNTEGLSFPFSVPLSFLSENFIYNDGSLTEGLTFELRP